MSRIVTTKLGRFRGVTDGKKNWWLWECPHCKTWADLSFDQLEGRVSVYCDAPVRCHYAGEPGRHLPDGSWRPGEVVTRHCGYHQTHEYAKELVTTIQARALMGENPFEEDKEAA